MKVHKLFIYFLIAASFLMITACGGGGGGDSAGSGELAIDITDAKPLLPEGTTNLWITFTEVLVHRSGGGGWESLPLIGDLPSNTIDLLQFHSGNTTELVPPVILASGKYTQIRLVIAEVDGALIKFQDDPTEYPVVIPPEHLKTDKNFDFNVVNGGAVDILIDFDLSQSLVVTDNGGGTFSYKLKPVLHIVDASKAATIYGEISNESFGDSFATVTVFYFKSDPTSPGGGVYEEYTKVEVPKSDTPPTTGFRIYWLVPDNTYIIKIDYKSDGSLVDESEPIYLGVGAEEDLGTFPKTP